MRLLLPQCHFSILGTGPFKMKSTSQKLIQFQNKISPRNFFTSFSREPYLIKRRRGCGKKRVLLFFPNKTNSSPNLPNQACYFGPLKSDQIKGRIPQRFMTTTCGYLLARKGPGSFFWRKPSFDFCLQAFSFCIQFVCRRKLSGLSS